MKCCGAYEQRLVLVSCIGKNGKSGFKKIPDTRYECVVKDCTFPRNESRGAPPCLQPSLRGSQMPVALTCQAGLPAPVPPGSPLLPSPSASGVQTYRQK